MPNWCYNSFDLYGPKDKLDKIYDQVNSYAKDGEKGLLDALCPMPQEVRDTLKEGSETQDWYSWSIDNWGTKWEVQTELELVDIGENETRISGSFDSAWGPPIQAYETFLANNPECELSSEYEEPGMDFAGTFYNNNHQHLDNLTEYADEVIKNKLEQSDNELFNELDKSFDIVEKRAEWLEMNEEEDDA